MKKDRYRVRDMMVHFVWVWCSSLHYQSTTGNSHFSGDAVGSGYTQKVNGICCILGLAQAI